MNPGLHVHNTIQYNTIQYNTQYIHDNDRVEEDWCERSKSGETVERVSSTRTCTPSHSVAHGQTVAHKALNVYCQPHTRTHTSTQGT